MAKNKKHKRKTDEGKSEYTPKEARKASKKRKIEDDVSQSSSVPTSSSAPTSSSVPTRHSSRIARQESDLTRATRSLRIDSDSGASTDHGLKQVYSLKHVPLYASKFSEEDMKAFNATFVPTSDEDALIPVVEVTNFPNKYDLSNIGRDVLERKKFDVRKLKDSGGDNPDGFVKQFYKSLHRVVMNSSLDIATEESKTDTLMNLLLTRACGFDEFPFGVRLKETYKLFISDKKVSASPDFVVDMDDVAIIVTEDKHMKNVSPPNYGEAQILAEILACGNNNLRLAKAVIDQTIYAIRVISSYVTFYKAEIPQAYWTELQKGLPQNQKIKILRWPEGNDEESGLDLAVPEERRAVLEAVIKIRQFLLQSPSTTRIVAPARKISKREGKKPMK